MEEGVLEQDRTQDQSAKSQATAFYQGTKIINQFLDSNNVRDLNQTNHLLDALGFIIPWVLIIANAYLLIHLSIGMVWVFCLVLQGFFMWMPFYYGHDAMVHRQIFGPKISRYYMTLVMSLVSLGTGTGFRKTHLKHHRDLLTTDDPETYKQELNRLSTKIAMLTLPGMHYVMKKYSPNSPIHAKSEQLSAEELREWKFRQVLKALLIVSLIFIPKIAFFGYVLPLCTSAPIANFFRIMWEHSEANVENPLHNGLRLNHPVVNVLTLWSVGSAHMVHHYLPSIPFYRIPKAIKILDPLLDQYQVPHHESVLKVLHLWISHNKNHGKFWLKEGF